MCKVDSALRYKFAFIENSLYKNIVGKHATSDDLSVFLSNAENEKIEKLLSPVTQSMLLTINAFCLNKLLTLYEVLPFNLRTSITIKNLNVEDSKLSVDNVNELLFEIKDHETINDSIQKETVGDSLKKYYEFEVTPSRTILVKFERGFCTYLAASKENYKEFLLDCICEEDKLTGSSTRDLIKRMLVFNKKCTDIRLLTLSMTTVL